MAGPVPTGLSPLVDGPGTADNRFRRLVKEGERTNREGTTMKKSLSDLLSTLNYELNDNLEVVLTEDSRGMFSLTVTVQKSSPDARVSLLMNSLRPKEVIDSLSHLILV